MSIPILYWMLECTGCGTRRVVLDSFFELVAPADLDTGTFGSGHHKTPLHERYTCANGCPQPMKTIGSIFDPDDQTLRLYEPPMRVTMTKAESEQWRQLIVSAGLKREPQEDRRRRWPWVRG